MIRIITDSAADIPRAEARALGVGYVPLSIRFPEYAYDEAQDEDFSIFYKLLAMAKEFPTTSQPPPEPFIAMFQEAKAAGDSVICITLSSKLSGTMQSAQIAKDTVGYENIHLLDSGTVAIAERILVEQAVKLRAEGKDFQTLVAELEALRGRIRLWALLDTLTYLYKGGRLSRTSAFAGNLLRIKPVITIADGIVQLDGKARSYQAVLDRFAQAPGFDPAYPVHFGYSSVDDTCLKMARQAQEQFPIVKSGIFPIGSVIGAHAGPGACAVAYVSAE